MDYRTLSSAQTFNWKCIFPVVWISGFGIGTLAIFAGAFSKSEPPPPIGVKWAFLAMWVVGSTKLKKSSVRSAVSVRVQLSSRDFNSFEHDRSGHREEEWYRLQIRLHEGASGSGGFENRAGIIFRQSRL